LNGGSQRQKAKSLKQKAIGNRQSIAFTEEKIFQKRSKGAKLKTDQLCSFFLPGGFA
jgi:hypothetical protein